jgi:nucleoside-diphosphate-sugar epimerase
LTETDPPNPRTDYGTSKLQGEEALIDSGLPYSILRPAYIYGPYPRIGSSMDRAVHDVRQGRRYTRFPFPGRASEIFVGDLAKAVWLAATAPQAENQAFFIANEQPVIVGDFLQQLAEALHVPFSHRLHTPGEIARIRGFVQRRKPENPMLPILFEDYFTCSPQKFMTLTGYRPQDGLTRGLEKTVAWYRANGLLN